MKVGGGEEEGYVCYSYNTGGELNESQLSSVQLSTDHSTMEYKRRGRRGVLCIRWINGCVFYVSVGSTGVFYVSVGSTDTPLTSSDES
jgi:hypothetical protein